MEREALEWYKEEYPVTKVLIGEQVVPYDGMAEDAIQGQKFYDEFFGGTAIYLGASKTYFLGQKEFTCDPAKHFFRDPRKG